MLSHKVRDKRLGAVLSELAEETLGVLSSEAARKRLRDWGDLKNWSCRRLDASGFCRTAVFAHDGYDLTLETGRMYDVILRLRRPEPLAGKRRELVYATGGGLRYVDLSAGTPDVTFIDGRRFSSCHCQLHNIIGKYGHDDTAMYAMADEGGWQSGLGSFGGEKMFYGLFRLDNYAHVPLRDVLLAQRQALHYVRATDETEGLRKRFVGSV